MSMEWKEILIALLRSTITGEILSEEEKEQFPYEMLPEVYAMAAKHDVAHLLGQALYVNGLNEEAEKQQKDCMAKVQQAQWMAVYRYEMIQGELNVLCEALEKEGIPFLPLKGSVLRAYYPEPWMRTSCDIDILIHEEDVEKAVTALTEKYAYSYEGKDSHDVSLYSKTKVHLELHFRLIEEGRANQSDKVLTRVWEMAQLADGLEYHYVMPDALFYLYHVAHMAKHFQIGGCGMRSVMDLWILNQIEERDEKGRADLLEQSGLLSFARAIESLSSTWFSCTEMTKGIKQLEQYILQGGVYGTLENKIVIQQKIRGGKLQYAWSRIFLPYERMQYDYPILQKYKWLIPVMQVRRWIRILALGRAKRSFKELHYSQKISTTEQDFIREMLEEIGLE